jgi:hypothetical protein
MLTLVGCSKEMIVGTTFSDWLHPDDSLESSRQIQQVGSRPSEWQDRWCRKDGRVVRLSWRAQASGRYVIAIARDITERLHGENPLEYVAERLADLDRITKRIKEDSDRASAASTSAEADVYENGVSGWKRWSGPIGWVAGLLVTVFSAGVAWSVFAGATATDSEVHEKVESALRHHNGGVLEFEIDPADGVPYGAHPELRDALQENAKAIKTLTEHQARDAVEDGRMKKRLKYLYELGRWEAQSLDRERKGLKPSGRPEALDALESELIND